MKPLLAVALLATLALAGCTGSGGPDFVVPSQDDEGRYVIAMTDGPFRFEPAHALVPVGATVVWSNQGSIAHNVHADDNAWQHDDPSTQDFVLQISEGLLGSHPYFCDPHQSLGMTGTLKVVSQADFDAMAPA